MNNEQRKKARKLAARRATLADIARELGVSADEVRAALASAAVKRNKPAAPTANSRAVREPEPAGTRRRMRAFGYAGKPDSRASLGTVNGLGSRIGGGGRITTWQQKLQKQGILPGPSGSGRGGL